MNRLGAVATPTDRLGSAPVLLPGRFAFALPSLVLDRRDKPFQPRMFQNDVLPVCTAAGLANAALAIGALDGIEVDIADAAVPRFYAECVQCDPTEEAIAATSGAVILDVLQRQVLRGFDAGGQTPLVGLHGTVPLTRTALARTTEDFGCVYLGVRLHDRDMQGGLVLNDVGDPGPVVGDHLEIIWDYEGLSDDDVVRVATWGDLQMVTWGWIRTRAVEAHGLFWRQLSPARMTVAEQDRLAMQVQQIGQA